MREDAGTPKMKEVWTAIKDGADAYLSRQLRSILPLIGVLTVALFFSVYIVPPSPEALERFADKTPDQVRMIIGLARSVAFIMGTSEPVASRMTWKNMPGNSFIMTPPFSPSAIWVTSGGTDFPANCQRDKLLAS